MHKCQNLKNNKWFNLSAIILWAFLCTLISFALCAKPYAMSASLFKSYISSPAIVAVNLLPFLIMTLLGFFASNRMWVGFAVGSVPAMVLMYINYFKMTFRNDPFTMVDLSLVSEAANMGERYSFLPDATMSAAIALVICGVVLAAIWYKYKMPNKGTCIGGAVATVIAAVLVFEFVYMSGGVYAAIENIEKNSSFMSVTSKNDQYVCRGFVYSFLHSADDLVQRPPEGYKAKEAKAILDGYTDDTIPDDKKVNIIAVMLEAYNDFSKFDNVKFKNNPYTDYYYVKRRSTYGELFTNIFGGGTIDTERAFATGFSYQYDYRYPVETYVSYLKSQGYTVEGGHPGHNWFYKRDAVNANFGFENYYFLENRYQQLYNSVEHQINDGILEDKYFFEDIISLYGQNKQSGKPYFNFSVSYQNHGPYDGTKLVMGKEYVAKTSNMTDETYNIINNYFAGIEQTSKECKKLIEWARSQREPIMIVLFGDHNPWMGNGMSGYFDLGININTATDEGVYNYYSTPYVIYSNRAAKQTSGNSGVGYGGEFSPMFLMNKVFEVNGWGGSRFMKISNELKQHIDIVTYTGQVRQNGEFTDFPDADGFEALSKLRKVEYYLMDKK